MDSYRANYPDTPVAPIDIRSITRRGGKDYVIKWFKEPAEAVGRQRRAALRAGELAACDLVAGRVLLQRDWQATHHQAKAPEGLTLLFPMNDLFEKYIAVLLRRALVGTGIEVIDQGGHRACLGAFTGEYLENGDVFRTMPDIMLRRRGEIVAIIDTKWKKLSFDPLDRKQGVSQADVYQLMAYARLYRTAELMLLYPGKPGQGCSERAQFGIAGGRERLRIATADISLDEQVLTKALRRLVTAPSVTAAGPLALVAG